MKGEGGEGAVRGGGEEKKKAKRWSTRKKGCF